MNISEFSKYVYELAAANNVFVSLIPSDEIFTEEGVGCSGFFDDDMRLLAVAVGRPRNNWFPIFVHEFCHMTQWVDYQDGRCPIWGMATKDIPGVGSYDNIIDRWLNGEEFDQDTISDGVRFTIELETDCESRSVEFIKENYLPIDLTRYIKSANAYIALWKSVLDMRLFTDGYMADAILDVMPGDRILGVDEKMPEEHLRLMRKYCSSKEAGTGRFY